MLTAEERQRVESFAHRSRSAAALARRARIILACAEGTVGQLIVELDVGVLQPERAHEVRRRFNRRRSLLTVERILAGVEVADHFDHEGLFAGGAVVAGRARRREVPVPRYMDGRTYRLSRTSEGLSHHPSPKKSAGRGKLFDSNYSLRRIRCAD
jgi:hypothetical protein